MTDFIPLSDSFSVAGQIDTQDVARAAEQGFGFIVNNRPDREAPGQPGGAEIEAAALDAGLGYLAIPIDHSGFTPEQVAALSALLVSPRRILAYCRSGTRSTNLWALAQASRGTPPGEIMASAAAAGYDVRGLAPILEQLSAQR